MIPKPVRLAILVCLGGLISVTLGAQQPPKARPATAAAARSAMKPVASMKDVMQAITIPTSETVFKAGSEPPKDAAGWDHLRKQAIALAESANLLLIDGRKPAGAEWTKLAVAQRDAALVAVKAIDAKDGTALASAADALYETCDNCHNKYMKK